MNRELSESNMYNDSIHGLSEDTIEFINLHYKDGQQYTPFGDM